MKIMHLEAIFGDVSEMAGHFNSYEFIKHMERNLDFLPLNFHGIFFQLGIYQTECDCLIYNADINEFLDKSDTVFLIGHMVGDVSMNTGYSRPIVNSVLIRYLYSS